MYYSIFFFFVVAWIAILTNMIESIDMRIEIRERQIVNKKEGIQIVGIKNTKKGKRSKRIRLPKWIHFLIPRYKYEGSIHALHQEYSGGRTSKEAYLATLIISMFHYVVGISLLCLGLILRSFDLSFMLLMLELLVLGLVELYYYLKK